MRRMILAFLLGLPFSGCASTQKGQFWYEYPGIVLGGAGYGVLIGPENVSIREAHRRYARKHGGCRKDEFFPSYVAGTLLHLGSIIPLFVFVPPFGLAYLGLSSIVGAAQFNERGGWEAECGP